MFLLVLATLLQLSCLEKLCCGDITSSSNSRLLANVNLSTISYDEIHRLAIIDQVQHYQPAQKSLHTRQTRPLNGLYNFCFDPNSDGFSDEWFSSSLRQKCNFDNFFRMPVPAAFNDIASNTTTKNYIGWFWYQTTINWPGAAVVQQTDSDSNDWNWFVQFESVNYLSIVWIQQIDQAKGTNITYYLGSHVGGHLPFMLNITDAIQAATAKTTTIFRLTVAVSNKLTQDTIPSGKMVNLTEIVGYNYQKFEPDFDFFHFAGIMGSVNLIQLPQIHFAHIDQIFIEDDPSSKLAFNVCLSHYTAGQNDKQPVEIKLESSMLTFDSQQLINGIKTSSANSMFDRDINSRCNIMEFEANRLDSWSTADGNPNHFSSLVTVRFKLEISYFNSITPTQSSQIDLFELKVAPRGRRIMSGERQLQGFGMHHEQVFGGRTMTEAAIMKDMYLLKQVGANVIRTSHYPYSVEYLDACDENGIMVIAECPAVGLRWFSNVKLALHKQILLEMMQRDHHHPSIIVWSVANEPQSQMKEAKGYFESLLRYARVDLAQYTVKAGRLLTAAIAQSHLDDKVAHSLDLIMVNRYYGWYDYTAVIEAIRLPLIASLQGWSSKHPGKPLILSEFGADTVSGLHKSTRELFSEEYQRDLLVEHERVFDEIVGNKSSNGINFWGSMIWNFADFSTHDSLLRVGGNKKGIFTRDREPKMSVASITNIYLSRLGFPSGRRVGGSLCLQAGGARSAS